MLDQGDPTDEDIKNAQKDDLNDDLDLKDPEDLKDEKVKPLSVTDDESFAGDSTAEPVDIDAALAEVGRSGDGDDGPKPLGEN